MKMKQRYFTNDWTNKDIDDKTLLELIEHERILVTPHIAFFSDEAVQNLVEGGLNAEHYLSLTLVHVKHV